MKFFSLDIASIAIATSSNDAHNYTPYCGKYGPFETLLPSMGYCFVSVLATLLSLSLIAAVLKYQLHSGGFSTITNRDTLILHVLVAIAFSRSFSAFLHIWGAIKEDHNTKFPATEFFRLLGDYAVGANVAALCLSRCCEIEHSLRNDTSNRSWHTYSLIVCSLAFALIITIARLCTTDDIACELVLSSIGYALPLLISLSAYVRLIFALRRKLRKISTRDMRCDLLIEQRNDASKHIGHLVALHLLYVGTIPAIAILRHVRISCSIPDWLALLYPLSLALLPLYLICVEKEYWYHVKALCCRK